MIKGCKKRVIYIKNTNSEAFDEAFFVMKNAKERPYLSDREMVAEAERILFGDCAETCVEKRRRRGVFFYFLGVVSAVFSYVALRIVFWLI